MSTNGWKPRKSIYLECPSGQKVTVRRPGPEFALRAGRVTKTFTKSKEEQAENQSKTPEEIMAAMSDEELAALTIFARELVVAMMVSPKLVLNPNPDRDEIGPDDIDSDFWFLFNYGMENFYGIKVPVGDDGEVEVKDLESFREDAGVSGHSMDGVHIRTETEQVDGDRGLVSSVGV